jgi:hypothetical protein
MSEPRCPGRRMNRRSAVVLSGALAASALVVAALLLVFGTRTAIPLAIAALAASVQNVRRALVFAGSHARFLIRHHGQTLADPFEIL